MILTGMLFSFATVLASEGRRAKPGTYELYSWREPNADQLLFSLLPHMNRYYSAEEVFNQSESIRGIHQLKQRIAKLPAGTVVFWPASLQGGSTQRLEYPSDRVIRDLQTYAGKYQVQIDVEGQRATPNPIK